MQSIKADPQSGIDSRWYRQLKPLMDEVGETFIALMPSAEKLQQAYEAFESSNYRVSPELFPEVPNAHDLAVVRDKLDGLQEDIEDDEASEEVRELYITRIQELVANIDMLLAARAGNKAGFIKANKFIYGSPDRNIFAAACEWIRQEVQKEYGEAVSAELRAEILSLVPDIHGDAPLLPNDEVFQKVKQLHFETGGYIDQLFGPVDIPADTIITPEIGDPITRRVIHNIGASYDLGDSPDGLWAVLQSKHQVVRPTNTSLTKQGFMAIVAHEAGSHLLEATNGALSSLKLLEAGLDRYEYSNEGRAFLREQIMYDNFDAYINQPVWFPTKASWEYRVAIHVIISLAVGLNGREYNFAELYHLLSLLFRFWMAKRGQEIDDEVIRQGAWNMLVRALKGTDGQGGAYYKDIVYLEGNIRCWQLAAERSELIMYGDLGKFDIANRKHVESLTRIGILPE